MPSHLECPTCGSEAPASARFCVECGGRLEKRRGLFKRSRKTVDRDAPTAMLAASDVQEKLERAKKQAESSPPAEEDAEEARPAKGFDSEATMRGAPRTPVLAEEDDGEPKRTEGFDSEATMRGAPRSQPLAPGSGDSAPDFDAEAKTRRMPAATDLAPSEAGGGPGEGEGESPSAGQTLADRYRLEAPIGHGGMGQVWAARDLMLGEEVAVKLMHRSDSVGDDARRFLREGRVTRRLNHPNIARTMNIEREGDLVFIVMERLHGRTLFEWMEAHPPPRPLSVVAELGDRLLAGLDEAHLQGVVHRDIKPQNVFLVDGSRGLVPKIMDFGLAKQVEGDAGITRTKQVGGTYAYMAPELALGFANAEPRTDLYSFSVMMNQVLSGALPLGGRVSEGVPRAFRGVLTRGLAENPEERWGSAAEMREVWNRVAEAALKPDTRSADVSAAQVAAPLGPAAGAPDPPPARQGKPGSCAGQAALLLLSLAGLGALVAAGWLGS